LIFVCDRTLGRLAKWLRILGIKTEYINTGNDSDLIFKISKMEDAFLLTKSMKIMEKACFPNARLIISNDYKNQLKEIKDLLPLTIANNLFSLCSVCNIKLEPKDKTKVKGLVPDFIFENNNEFKVCNSCKRIYWEGTHIEKMKSVLKKILR
jgi:uncharacterized protein